MNGMSSLADSISTTLQVNHSTLSGAIDVVVVPQEAAVALEMTTSVVAVMAVIAAATLRCSTAPLSTVL